MPQNDVDGKAYYTFEFVAQAPNYTRHALGAASVGNGMNLHPEPESYYSPENVPCTLRLVLSFKIHHRSSVQALLFKLSELIIVTNKH